MNINELILNITDRYKMPATPEENQRTTDLYKHDFGFYSPSKLDKVWYAIKRYHHTNFAPNYSNIASCMEKAGVGESKQDGDSLWYQQCKTCNTKYSMGVSCCPKCNKHREVGDNFKNYVTVIKCKVLPNDVIFLRQACPICPLFKASASYPRGVKCDSFQGEMRGQLPECDKCNCRECCEDLGMKNEDMPEGALLDVTMQKLVTKVKKL